MGNLIPTTGSSLNILSLRLSSAQMQVQVLGSVHTFPPNKYSISLVASLFRTMEP